MIDVAETRIERALFNAIRNLARGVRPGASFHVLRIHMIISQMAGTPPY